MRVRSSLAVLGSLALACAAVVAHAPAVDAIPAGTLFEANGTYVVPTGVCEVTITAYGGGGGAGSESNGGKGGATVADFSVVPGSSLDVFVGKAGDTDSSGGAGFDAGGDPGNGGEGSGGGSSAVLSGSNVLVVAGGGGGGGSSGDGGDGGVKTFFNDGDGEDGFGSSDAGTGGTGGDPHAVGGDATNNGGAGGAGAGPGTGATDVSGGGGGATWVNPAFVVGSASDPTGETTGNGSVTIVPAEVGVGCPPVLSVKKVVVGPATGPFVVQVNCTRPVEVPAEVTSEAVETTVDHVNLTYKGDGTPDAASTPSGWVVSGGVWQLAQASLADSTCTATETTTSGATSVSYACTWTAGLSDHLADVGCPGASSGPSATPRSVLFEGGGDHALLTVTNTFPTPPPPPPPVVIQPTFTG